MEETAPTAEAVKEPTPEPTAQHPAAEGEAAQQDGNAANQNQPGELGCAARSTCSSELNLVMGGPPSC